MPQFSVGMSSIITKAIIRCKYFQSVGLDSLVLCKFHTAKPFLVKGVVGKRHPTDVKSEKATGPEDFFGIESDAGLIHVTEKTTQSGAGRLGDLNNLSSKNEQLLKTSFGHLRFDLDNQPKIHGQFEENIAESEFSYGDRAEKRKMQYKRLQKEREIALVEKVCLTSVGKELHDSTQSTNERALTGSDDLMADSGGSGFEKLDLGFFDRAFFNDETSTVRSSSDLRKGKLCVDSDMLENNTQGKEVKEDNLEFPKNNSADQPEGQSSFIDSTYFEHLYDVSGSSSSGHSHQAAPKSVVSIENQTSDYAGSSSELKTEENVNREFNFIDSVYFGTVAESTPTSPGNGNLPVFPTPDDKDVHANSESQDINDTRVDNSNFEINHGTKENLSPLVEQDCRVSVSENEVGLSQGFLKEKQLINELRSELHVSVTEHPDLQEAANEDEVHTAYKYVLKLRKNSGTPGTETGVKLDSKGFRILKNQVPDLSRLTRSELTDLLKERVLFCNDDVVILNKPYNLVVHESQTTSMPTLSSVLDDLAHRLDTVAANPQLYTVHRLDKETTGCLLLARTELAAQKLKALFLHRRIEKNYLIITTRVPDPYEGIIDIPIAEGKIENRVRMALQPDIPKEIKYKTHVKNGKRAITYYKVVSTSENAALLEVRPETGLKHQIRVHLGFGLNCPILGDHKYSHLTKLAPQRLSGDILRKLGVQQSKVRHVPMHIHSRSIVIPEYLQGRDLFVSAPLPEHFRSTIKCLKFKDI